MSQRDVSGRVTDDEGSEPRPGDPLAVHRPFRRRPVVAFATGVLAGGAAAVVIMLAVVLAGPGIVDGVQDAVDAAVGTDATGTADGDDVAPSSSSLPSTSLSSTSDTSVVDASTTAAPSLLGTSMSGRRVVAVGDSLLESVSQALSNRLAPAEIEIDAEQSRPVEGGVSPLRDLVDGDADIVVVALGTNNVNPGFEFEGYVEAVADEAAGAACVIWVNVQEFRPGLETVNDVIHEVAAERGFDVVEWSQVAGESELHAGDGYHLSPAGQSAYADLIADGVRDCPPADDGFDFGD